MDDPVTDSPKATGGAPRRNGHVAPTVGGSADDPLSDRVEDAVGDEPMEATH